jgi:ribosomal protein L23
MPKKTKTIISKPNSKKKVIMKARQDGKKKTIVGMASGSSR